LDIIPGGNKLYVFCFFTCNRNLEALDFTPVFNRLNGVSHSTEYFRKGDRSGSPEKLPDRDAFEKRLAGFKHLVELFREQDEMFCNVEIDETSVLYSV